MKTRKTLKIFDKIFTKEKIRSFWKTINEEYCSSLEEHSSIKIIITSDDNMSYETEIDDVLQDGDIIDIKKCTEIQIEYSNYKQGRGISLSLSHGNSEYNNTLIVRGDKDWVLGKFDTLNSIIKSSKPQKHWFVTFHSLISFSGIF